MAWLCVGSAPVASPAASLSPSLHGHRAAPCPLEDAGGWTCALGVSAPAFPTPLCRGEEGVACRVGRSSVVGTAARELVLSSWVLCPRSLSTAALCPLTFLSPAAFSTLSPVCPEFQPSSRWSFYCAAFNAHEGALGSVALCTLWWLGFLSFPERTLPRFLKGLHPTL